MRPRRSAVPGGRAWAGLAVVAAQLACRAPAPVAWQAADGYQWQPLASPGSETPGFTSLSSSRTGVAFRNDVSDSLAFANRHLVQGSGVAIGDVNGDDLPDLYLARIAGPYALYLNRGGMRFEAMADAGVTLADHPSTGAVLTDVDGDGDRDLIVTAMGGRNRLLRNDGTGRFADVTDSSGFVPEARGSTTPTLADVDGDGDLDLYVANYKAKTMLDSLSPQERAFDQLVRRSGTGFEVVAPLRDNYRVVLRDDIRGVSVVQRADPDWFYRNEGGRFVAEPLAGNPRFVDERGTPLEREPDDFGLAARFFDVNGDGAPDLYVANDFEDPDQFWLNDGRGGFRLVDARAVRQTSNSGMAVDAADFDRDGDVDVFEVDMLANDSHRRKTQIPTHTPLPKVVGDYDRRAQWQRNVLLANRGDGTFAEIGRQAGVEASGWSWSAMFVDADLDGFEDLLIGTGHRWDLMDADVQERLKSTVTGVDWREERKLYPRLALKNVAFRNRGDGTFEDATDRWRFGVEEDISHGMAAGDLDGDGDLDVVVNRLDAPALVLRNDAVAPRVLVELAGRAPNGDGVGATISVITKGLPTQTREVAAGGLYLSGSDRAAAFAAPGDSVTIAVRWRSGVVSRLVGVPAGRRCRIAEPEGPAPVVVPPEAPPPPLFDDVSALLGHQHAERYFEDYRRQPLLITQLSQMGPGVAWTDLDQDGDDDLVVGTGAGGRLGVFRNDRGRFGALPGTMAADSFDFTAVVGDDRGAVYVGQSSYEASTPQSAIAAPAVFRVERGRPPAVVAPGDTTSAGPVALADLDGDGDLDLFVGGRMAPGVYPAPGTSRIFRRDGAGFVPDPDNAAVLRTIGMVSGAVFSDLDGDGDPDLALALDWGPIRVLRNDGGRLSDQTRAWGLDSLTGRWNSVSAGDFDGDGRIDLVAGNWGRNTGAVVDRDHPLHLYFGSWAEDGSVAMSPALHDPRLNGVALTVTLGRLTAAVPSQRTRTPTFAAYADATVERALGPLLARTGRLTATTFDHTVFLNRGDRFEARALPTEAQVAPVFGVAVADFDGNGTEDLFLAQNFSPTNIAAPTFDAGQGLVLVGDGRGGFAALAGTASGIRLHADQRGAAVADFDGDGRVDLVVGQNAATTKLFRNRAGVPGLRVAFQGGRVAGAVVRLKYDDGLGPAREVHLGGGYWSQDGGVLVLGKRAPVRAVVVRWPGGATDEIPVGADQAEVVVRPSGR